jgi:hypothetical protein
MEGDPVTIPIQKLAVTATIRIQPGEPLGAVMSGWLPRIMRLLALAVRFGETK